MPEITLERILSHPDFWDMNEDEQREVFQKTFPDAGNDFFDMTPDERGVVRDRLMQQPEVEPEPEYEPAQEERPVQDLIPEYTPEEEIEDEFEPFAALGYGATEGAESFVRYLDNAATLVSRGLQKLGLPKEIYEKSGHFKDLADIIDADRWMDFQPEGFGEKVLSGVAAAPGEIAKIAVTPGGPIIGFGLVGAIDTAGQMIEAGEDTDAIVEAAVKAGFHGATMGALLHGAHKFIKPGVLKVSPMTANALRIPATGGVFGGMAAASGAGLEEIAEHGMVGAILALPGMKSPRKAGTIWATKQGKALWKRYLEENPDIKEKIDKKPELEEKIKESFVEGAREWERARLEDEALADRVQKEAESRLEGYVAPAREAPTRTTPQTKSEKAVMKEAEMMKAKVTRVEEVFKEETPEMFPERYTRRFEADVETPAARNLKSLADKLYRLEREKQALVEESIDFKPYVEAKKLAKDPAKREGTGPYEPRPNDIVVLRKRAGAIKFRGWIDKPGEGKVIKRIGGQGRRFKNAWEEMLEWEKVKEPINSIKGRKGRVVGGEKMISLKELIEITKDPSGHGFNKKELMKYAEKYIRNAKEEWLANVEYKEGFRKVKQRAEKEDKMKVRLFKPRIEALDKEIHKYKRAIERIEEQQPLSERKTLKTTDKINRDIEARITKELVERRVAEEGGKLDQDSIDGYSEFIQEAVRDHIKQADPRNVHYKMYLRYLHELNKQAEKQNIEQGVKRPTVSAQIERRLIETKTKEVDAKIDDVVAKTTNEALRFDVKGKIKEKAFEEHQRKSEAEYKKALKEKQNVKDLKEDVLTRELEQRGGHDWRDIERPDGSRIKVNEKRGVGMSREVAELIAQSKEISKPGLWTSIFTMPRVFTEIGQGLKQYIYYPMRAANKNRMLELGEIRVKMQNIKRDLGRGWKKSAKKIGEFAIAQQEGGKAYFEMKGKQIPKLTEREMRAYNKFREMFEEFHSDLNDVRLRHGKSELPKVDNYFTFMRAFGELAEWGLTAMSSGKDIVDMYKMKNSFGGKNDINVPFRFFRKRTGEISENFMTDPFKIMSIYASAATRYKHFQPVVERWNAVKEGVPTKDGVYKIGDHAKFATQRVDSWIADQLGIAKSSEAAKALAPIINRLNNNIAFAVLSFNVRSALIQPSALRNSITELNPKWFSEGLKGVVDPKMRKFVEENSNHIIKDSIHDTHMNELFADITMGRYKQKAAEMGMAWLQRLDREARIITWIGAYKKATQQLKMKKKDAINYADDIVIDTQASGARTDISPLQRDGLGRAVTALQTFVINDFNFLRDIFKGSAGNKKVTKGHIAGRLATYIGATIGLNMLYEGAFHINSPFPRPLHTLMKGLESEDELGDVAMETIKELAEPIPIIGGSIRYESAPLIFQTIADLAYREGLSVKQFESLLKLYGVPGTNQLAKQYRAMKRGENWFYSIAGKYRTKKEREEAQKEDVKLPSGLWGF